MTNDPKKRPSLVERAVERSTSAGQAQTRGIGSPGKGRGKGPSDKSVDRPEQKSGAATESEAGKQPRFNDDSPRDPSAMGVAADATKRRREGGIIGSSADAFTFPGRGAARSTPPRGSGREIGKARTTGTVHERPGPASAATRPDSPAKTTGRGGGPAPLHEDVDLNALREAGYITPDMPPSLMSEEFRIIKRSLLLNAFSKSEGRVEKGNLVLVTSANPGEGKSFCAINLALSIASEQDVTVLLVDADFSKPEVLNRLGVRGGKGLMDVVADKTLDVGDCLVRTNISNLVLLPAGRQHNLTTEMLASERMERIMKEIAERYPDRIIIFDSPPVLASSAASVMALYMGQIVFVVEAEKTTEPQIKESLSMISGCEHISLLLNKTRHSGSNKKFAAYYGYGRG
ncbi:XrtA-associated tyrosine autokinase [Yunchengibacter salinarum]|uniref:XrtA-associated tyrosine autokinase n=1 Tax=Yunchengibacter salinarum TaxID=3133399 RepID=UPI0035B63F3D